MIWRLRVPGLFYSHPNFFVIYAATACFHLWLGIAGLSGGPGDTAALRWVNNLASPATWGIASLCIAGGLFVGLWRHTFRLARLSLAAGATLVLVRAFLLSVPLVEAILNIDGGTRTGVLSVPAWLLIGALHISQTAEPPRNPQTETSRGPS